MQALLTHATLLEPALQSSQLQKELVENIQCIRVACCCVTMLVIFVLSMMIWIVVNQQVAEVDSVATPAFVDASVCEQCLCVCDSVFCGMQTAVSLTRGYEAGARGRLGRLVGRHSQDD